MKLKIIKAGPWNNIYGKRRVFKLDKVIEVGVDVPDDVAETMLRCDYAIKHDKHWIETKESTKEVEKVEISKPSSRKGRKPKGDNK